MSGRQQAIRGLAGVFAAAAVIGCGDPPPVAYVGGSILTMDAENRVVEGLAVDGGRIALVGDAERVRSWASERGAEVVDLAGRALLPGFIDAHGHFPGAGIYAIHVDLNAPPIGTVEDIEGLVARLAERADETGAGDWIVGWGYDDSLLQENRHPTRDELDRASTDHPIGILHVSGHLAVANSLALEQMGVSAETPDPEGGLIRRRPGSREPNGVLEENAAESLTRRLQPGFLEGLEIVREASRRYVAAGVTTAQSGATDAAIASVLPLLSRVGLIPLRLVIWPLPELADAILAGEFDAEDTPHWVKFGAVKLIADGSIQGYTGYLGEPYHVPPGDDPSYRGYPRISKHELAELVLRYHAAGLQVAVHGNGDASIDDILDAFEAAFRADSPKDARPILIHAQMARNDQLERMAKLELIPSFFSLHTFYWGDRHRSRFMGPARAARMSPARSALDRGVRFTIHCDTPVVPMEPLRLVWAAVNRQTRTGFVVGEAERIPVMQALRAVTIDAAFQHFDEADKGSLEPGKWADLVILSRSPLEDPATIDSIEVRETVIAGRSVYRAEQAD